MSRDEINTLSQIAKRMDCTARTVRRHIKAGRLKAVFITPKKRAVKESDYQRFIASLSGAKDSSS